MVPRRQSRLVEAHQSLSRGAEALFVGLWYLAVWRAPRPVEPGWLAVFVILQGLRVWVMASLGGRWTTRIIVLPGVPTVSCAIRITAW